MVKLEDIKPGGQTLALGVQHRVHENGHATVVLPYRQDLIGDPDTGVIAGGAVTTLLDNACGAAAHSLAPETSIATLDLRIDYMRPARPGQDIVAVAHCYKITKLIAFVRAIAHDGDPNDPVAAAQAAFMLDSNAGRPPGVNLQGLAE